MKLVYRSEANQDVVLYSEQKLDAQFTAAQKKGYPEFRQRGEKLILVAPDEERYQQAHQFDTHITWSDIALQLSVIGEAEARSNWRALAESLQGSASLRFVYEAHTFIRENAGVPDTRPLDPQMIDEYRRLASTRETMRDLLDLVRQDARIQSFDPEKTLHAEVHETHWYFTMEANCPLFRALEVDCAFEVCVRPNLDFPAERGDVPTLSVGFSCYPIDRQVPILLVDDPVVPDVLRRMDAQVAMRPGNSQCKCIVLRPLTEIAREGATLHDQAKSAAEWAAEIITAMGKIAPERA